MTFMVPALPQVPLHSLEMDSLQQHNLDSAQWYFYRYVNDQCPAWPGLLATVNREKSKLAMIIYDTVVLYGTSGAGIQARQILTLYVRYRTWRERLPASIGNIAKNNSQALPHLLSLL